VLILFVRVVVVLRLVVVEVVEVSGKKVLVVGVEVTIVDEPVV
jgi:hypothetical protein